MCCIKTSSAEVSEFFFAQTANNREPNISTANFFPGKILVVKHGFMFTGNFFFSQTKKNVKS